MNGKDGRLMR